MTPVVLVHGIFGFSKLGFGPLALRYFSGVETAIASRGHDVLSPRLHPWGAIDQRARMLRRAIVRWLKQRGNPDEQVILIAHSMGGLDARHMISRLGMAPKVKALVTISTPHRGTPHADFWHGHTLMRRVGWPFLSLIGLEMEAVAHLTRDKARQFNEETPDVEGVRYFSISCACPSQKVPVALLPSYGLIYRAEGENDGQVSVNSAVYGEHLATWPVHHFHAINHRFPRDLIERNSSIAPRYLELLDQLASRGIT
jgi:triacylglycerol lipase